MGEIGQYHWVTRQLAIWCGIVGRVIPKYQLLKFVLITHRIFFFFLDKRGLLLNALADLYLWCEIKKLKVKNLKVKKK